MGDASALLQFLQGKARKPAAIILGSPGEVMDLVSGLDIQDVVCFQMDLYQADRLQEGLKERGLTVKVVTAPDLWDLPGSFQTVLYPAPRGGERSLKIDMVEQAFHILEPGGKLFVWSPFEKDQFLPGLLKKIFGRFHAPAVADLQLFWGQRQGDRPRRRHEVTFHARCEGLSSLRFLSRPGTFSYGRLDPGARALIEIMAIQSGDCIVDVGCGCGTNGVVAGLRTGPTGGVAFIDSNLRALALADFNARTNGLVNFQTIASSKLEGLQCGDFDVALANPPYYAQLNIARLFIERSRTWLREGGKLFLVTKQADQLAPSIAEYFATATVVPQRGYQVICAET